MEMWFSEFHTPDVKHSIRVNRQLYSKQSDYQRIDIFETPEFGRVLTLDGNVMLTERDEFIYDEMITHVPMAVHRSAKDILVIGAGDGGVVRELTRYDRVERIDLVEMDPQVIEACRTYLPGGQVRPITEAITGPETLAALQHYNFTKAFMGANGVSPAEGFTTPDPEEASIKTAALQRARERWFLVDNTKFDMVYSAVIGDIGCGAILTNHCPDPRYAQLTFVKECSV